MRASRQAPLALACLLAAAGTAHAGRTLLQFNPDFRQFVQITVSLRGTCSAVLAVNPTLLNDVRLAAIADVRRELTANPVGIANLTATLASLRDAMWNAARRGICIGNYNREVWAQLTATLPAAFPVVYNSAWRWRARVRAPRTHKTPLSASACLHADACRPSCACGLRTQTARASTPTARATPRATRRLPTRCRTRP